MAKNEGSPLMLPHERRTVSFSSGSNQNNGSKRRIRMTSAGQLDQYRKPKPVQQEAPSEISMAPLNTQSHHYKSVVKPQQAKRQSEREEHDIYAEMEMRLIRSVQITETLASVVNERIHLAIQAQQLRIPIIGFMRSTRHGVEIVYDFSLLLKKYEIQCLNNPVHITEAQLSLDLFHAQKEYSTIVSILIHLQNYTPRLTYIISRQTLAYSERPPELFPLEQQGPPPQSENPEINTQLTPYQNNTPELGFVDRLLLNYMKMTETAYYYMIFIDLALSPYTTIHGNVDLNHTAMPRSETQPSRK